MVQAFLNQPSIETAHVKYLERWHLASVQRAWDGRKPTLAQFKKRFNEPFEARQRFVKRSSNVKINGDDPTIKDRHASHLHAIAESLLKAMMGEGPVVLEEEPELTGNSEPAAATEQQETRSVKPENYDELPRSGQVYFFIHKAIEAGEQFALIPVRRGVAAEGISLVRDDGLSYHAASVRLKKAYK